MIWAIWQVMCRPHRIALWFSRCKLEEGKDISEGKDIQGARILRGQGHSEDKDTRSVSNWAGRCWQKPASFPNLPP